MGNPKGVERDFDELERRRLKAARLFDRGLRQGEVSRRLGVHRQSVSRWHQAWRKQGTKALLKAARAGRKPRLLPCQLEQLGWGLKEGPEVLGYGTGLWTTWRVADLIERKILILEVREGWICLGRARDSYKKPSIRNRTRKAVSSGSR